MHYFNPISDCKKIKFKKKRHISFKKYNNNLRNTTETLCVPLFVSPNISETTKEFIFKNPRLRHSNIPPTYNRKEENNITQLTKQKNFRKLLFHKHTSSLMNYNYSPTTKTEFIKPTKTIELSTIYEKHQDQFHEYMPNTTSYDENSTTVSLSKANKISVLLKQIFGNNSEVNNLSFKSRSFMNKTNTEDIKKALEDSSTKVNITGNMISDKKLEVFKHNSTTFSQNEDYKIYLSNLLSGENNTLVENLQKQLKTVDMDKNCMLKQYQRIESNSQNPIIYFTDEMNHKVHENYCTSTINSAAKFTSKTKLKTSNFLNVSSSHKNMNDKHKYKLSNTDFKKNDRSKVNTSVNSKLVKTCLFNKITLLPVTNHTNLDLNTNKTSQTEYDKYEFLLSGDNTDNLSHFTRNKLLSCTNYSQNILQKSLSTEFVTNNISQTHQNYKDIGNFIKMFNLKRKEEHIVMTKITTPNALLLTSLSTIRGFDNFNKTHRNFPTDLQYLTTPYFTSHVSKQTVPIHKIHGNDNDIVHTYLFANNTINKKATTISSCSALRNGVFYNFKSEFPIREITSREPYTNNLTTKPLMPAYTNITTANYETQILPTISINKSVINLQNSIKPHCPGSIFNIKNQFAKWQAVRNRERNSLPTSGIITESFPLLYEEKTTLQNFKTNYLLTNFFQMEHILNLPNGTSQSELYNHNKFGNVTTPPITTCEFKCSTNHFVEKNTGYQMKDGVAYQTTEPFIKMSDSSMSTKKYNFKNMFRFYGGSTKNKLNQTKCEEENISDSRMINLISTTEGNYIAYTQCYCDSNSSKTIAKPPSFNNRMNNHENKGNRTLCYTNLNSNKNDSKVNYINYRKNTLFRNHTTVFKCANSFNMPFNQYQDSTMSHINTSSNICVECYTEHALNLKTTNKTKVKSIILQKKNNTKKTSNFVHFLKKNNITMPLKNDKQQINKFSTQHSKFTNLSRVVNKEDSINLKTKSLKHLVEVISNKTNKTLLFHPQYADYFNPYIKDNKNNTLASNNLTLINDSSLHIMAYVMKPIESILSIFRAAPPNNITKVAEVNTSNSNYENLPPHLKPPNSSIVILAINNTNSTGKDTHESKFGFFDLLGGWLHCIVDTYSEPKAEDIHFYLYTRNNSDIAEELFLPKEFQTKESDSEIPDPVFEGSSSSEPLPEIRRRQVDEPSGFESLNPAKTDIQSKWFNILTDTKILIHGYVQDYQTDIMVEMKDAYLTRRALNVVLVDWSLVVDNTCYPTVASKALLRVGRLVARMLNELVVGGVSLASIHIVGFSLGAHVAGHAGNEFTHGLVSRISGLDPALPYVPMDPDVSLDSGDAAFVDIIHSASGYLGQPGPMGHVDFYPNGGSQQPGCDIASLGTCSHRRSALYFIESINSDVDFEATQCDSWHDFQDGLCNQSEKIPMGDPCPTNSSGKYYLFTGQKEPYTNLPDEHVKVKKSLWFDFLYDDL